MDSSSDHVITRRGPKRSASVPPQNPPTPDMNRYSAMAVPASPTLMPWLVSSTGTNVANDSETTVRSTTSR